jgi:hypothetical protein
MMVSYSALRDILRGALECLGSIMHGLFHSLKIGDIAGQHHLDLIDETPAPILSGFEGRNNRMPGRGRMLACVAIFRIITTSHVTARPAQP